MKEDDKTILLLEENASIEERVHFILKNEGYNVDKASLKDKNIIDHVQNAHPSLILIDKPNLYNKIHKNNKTKHIPILLISKKEDTRITKQKTNSKINYIKYPFEIQDFLKVIYTYFPLNNDVLKAVPKQAQEENTSVEKLLSLKTAKPPETFTIGIFRTDKKGRFVYINNECYLIIKQQKKSLLGKHPLNLIYKNDLKKIISKLNNIGDKQSYAFKIRLKSSNTKLEVHIAKEIDKNGQHIGYIGSINDIEKEELPIATLIKNQQKSHSILSNLDEGIIYYNLNNGVEFYNSNARKLCGQDINDMSEKDIIKLWNKVINEDKSILRAREYPIHLTFKTGLSIHNKIIGIQKEEGITWLSLNTHAVYEDDLIKPSAVVLSFRDITKEKEALEEIRQNKEQLYTLINATPDLISFQDKRKRYIISNNAMLKLFSITNKKYIGKTNKQIIKELRPRYQTLLLKWQEDDIKNKKRIKRIEENINIANGQRKIYDIIKTPILKKNTKINGIVIVARDITLRKALEEKLEKALRERNIILDNSLSGIAYIKDNYYKWVNERFAKLLGYTKHEVENKSVKLIYPFSRKEYNNFIRKVSLRFRHKDSYSFDFPVMKKDGSIIWCSFAGKLVNPKQIADGSIWVMENISTEKQEREVLTLHKNQLEKIAKQQSIEINSLRDKLKDEITEHKMTVKELINLKEKYKSTL